MESNIKRNCNVDIFIYSHIPFRPATTDHVYKVLTNSREKSGKFDTDLEIFRDYTDDNIADKNIMYNEYSGIYWVWKNYPLKDYVGFNHYRRMYTTSKNELMEFGKMPTIDDLIYNGKYKIILNRKFELRWHPGMPNAGLLATNKEWYEFWHNIDDLNLLGDIIKEKYPDYIDGYEKMCNSKYLYPCSLFLMPTELFDEYCEFIFCVLDEFRKRRGFNTEEDCINYVKAHQDQYIKNDGFHGYYDVKMQSRIVGYIAERALATFLMHGGKDSLENHASFFNWAMIPESYYKI